MDRYDWEWSRPERWGGRGYDRGYGEGWWAGPRGGPGGGYRFHGGGGPRGGGRYGAAYDRWHRDWPPAQEHGYRFSYGRGEGRRFGRQEPWEPGPPGGYGGQWGEAYGNRPDRYDRGERYRGEPGPFASGGPFDPFGRDPYADLPDAPRGYYDGYDPAFDDESAAADAGAYLGGWDEDVPDDREVRDSVTRSLRDDGFIDPDAIQVEVKDRVVTLRGEVQDYMQARYAWDDAWDAPGVRGVISKLTVQGGGAEGREDGAAPPSS